MLELLIGLIVIIVPWLVGLLISVAPIAAFFYWFFWMEKVEKSQDRDAKIWGKNK